MLQVIDNSPSQAVNTNRGIKHMCIEKLMCEVLEEKHPRKKAVHKTIVAQLLKYFPILLKPITIWCSYQVSKLFSMRDFNRVSTKELKAAIAFIKNISLLHKTNYACGLVKNIYRDKKEKRNN